MSEPTKAELKEALQQERWQSDHLQESIRQLELHAAETGWRELAGRRSTEFSRDGLEMVAEMSRSMYLSNPLIQRAVNVRSYYTWGQGVTIQAADSGIQSEVVEPLMERYGNRVELFSHQARILSDVDQSLDGNTFMAMVTDINGEVDLRSIPSSQIRKIHTNPDDRQEIWFYERVWNEYRFNIKTGVEEASNDKVVYYPDWRYKLANDSKIPDTIGGKEVKKNSPIIHLKSGGLKHWQFGFPETYAAMDWARAYRKFLEDWHTIVSSLARFAWSRTVKNGSNIQKAKDQMNSSKTESNGREKNPPPSAGSVFVSTDKEELSPIPKTGAHTSADDARPSRLMVGAAMDLPDTILTGDTDVGNLATARSLDRPTELAIASRQSMWADFFRDIFYYALESKRNRGNVTSTDQAIDISFPPILEHDVNNTVSAIVSAATLDGKFDAGTIPRDKMAAMLMEALGVDDIEEQLENLPPDTREEVTESIEALKTMLGRANE